MAVLLHAGAGGGGQAVVGYGVVVGDLGASEVLVAEVGPDEAVPGGLAATFGVVWPVGGLGVGTDDEADSVVHVVGHGGMAWGDAGPAGGEGCAEAVGKRLPRGWC